MKTVIVKCGHLGNRDPNFGLTVTCFVCEQPHEAFGLARIQDSSSTTDVPLCELCLASSDISNVIVQKIYSSLSDVKIEDAGEITTKH